MIRARFMRNLCMSSVPQYPKNNTKGLVVRAFELDCGFGNDDVVYTCFDADFGVSSDAYCKRQIISKRLLYYFFDTDTSIC